MRRTQRREINGCRTTINLLPEVFLLYFTHEDHNKPSISLRT